MIVADRDGVVVVPFEDLDTVITQLEIVRKLEAELDAEIENGLKMPEKMVELLKSDRVSYID